MAKKKYKVVYSIKRTIYKPQPQISCHLMEDHPKTYCDVTAPFIRYMREECEKQGRNPEEVYKGDWDYIGYRLSKDNEYKLAHDKYWIFMFGSDLKELIDSWNNAFIVSGEIKRGESKRNSECYFDINSRLLSGYAEQLNTERIEYHGN